jgi:hypothetical protein
VEAVSFSLMAVAELIVMIWTGVELMDAEEDMVKI